QMMDQLGISSIRHGPSGNPQDPNAANSDEEKVLPYFLPDPLVFNNGNRVKTPGEWEQRRDEIVDLFDLEMYGRLPDNIPDVAWKVVSIKDTMDGEFPVSIKQLEGVVDNAAYPEISVVIRLTVGIPSASKNPVPVIMEFGFDFSRWMGRRQASPELTWKQQLLKKGWGYAYLNPMSIQADNGAGLREGIIGLVNKGEYRKPDDWGALRAWGWGASKAIDYFETDKDVDEKRIGIEGLSRYGKAAIVAMAYEPRIAIGFIGSSGAGGAKLLHRVFGEQVENLAGSGEYHWFAGNFIKYASDPLTQEDLPVDAHHLVALCAPRPVFISSGSASVEGQWVDAKGMFLGGAMAGPVYELLEKRSMRTMLFPPQETLVDGDVAFRQHEGGHTTGPNWPYFIAFASRYFEE
ncbi:acetylxylan esterase, partial [Bacteroidota bacterium]